MPFSDSTALWATLAHPSDNIPVMIIRVGEGQEKRLLANESEEFLQELYQKRKLHTITKLTWDDGKALSAAELLAKITPSPTKK